MYAAKVGAVHVAPTDGRPDAFISHSSRDKNLFVRPLVECLAEHGVNVWYDEYSMQPGDSLSACIDRGLVTARYGVVIVSPSFIETALASGWTHYELRGIISNSVGTPNRRIVPVWLDVDADDVRSWSPPLADLLAITARQKTIDAVALEIMGVIAPNRTGGLQRQRLLEVIDRTGTLTQEDPRKLLRSPAEDRRVAGNVPLRALLLTQALADCGEAYASDLPAFLEDLSRDLHHERELRIWEAIAGSYSMACSTFDLSPPQRNSVYHALLSATFGKVDESALKALPDEVIDPVLVHFDTLMKMVHNEAVIGEGGLRGYIPTSAVDESDTAEATQ